MVNKTELSIVLINVGERGKAAKKFFEKVLKMVNKTGLPIVLINVRTNERRVEDAKRVPWVRFKKVNKNTLICGS